MGNYNVCILDFFRKKNWRKGKKIVFADIIVENILSLKKVL